MSDRRLFTVAEKLAEIEELIELYRFARRFPDDPEYQTYLILKAVAEDLRARTNGAAGDARRELGRRIAAAVRTSDGMPNSTFANAVLGVGQELIGRWPVVEQALERYEEERGGQ